MYPSVWYPSPNPSEHFQEIMSFPDPSNSKGIRFRFGVETAVSSSDNRAQKLKVSNQLTAKANEIQSSPIG